MHILKMIFSLLMVCLVLQACTDPYALPDDWDKQDRNHINLTSYCVNSLDSGIEKRFIGRIDTFHIDTVVKGTFTWEQKVNAKEVLISLKIYASQPISDKLYCYLNDKQKVSHANSCSWMEYEIPAMYIGF